MLIPTLTEMERLGGDIMFNMRILHLIHENGEVLEAIGVQTCGTTNVSDANSDGILMEQEVSTEVYQMGIVQLM